MTFLFSILEDNKILESEANHGTSTARGGQCVQVLPPKLFN